MMHLGNDEFHVRSEFSLYPVPFTLHLVEIFSVWHTDKTNSNINAGFSLSLFF